MGIAVIEGGAVVFTKGYGFADVAAKTPVTENTRFRAGSISKVFIGLSAMALVEEGKLSLDTPMAELAPEVPVRNPFGQDAPLRLVHLLEHTSGWADYTLKQFATHGRGMRLADAVLKDSPYTVRYAPGLYYAYANPGSAAAALMVERASGTPYYDFVKSRWLEPLGMASATFDRPVRDLAVSYLADRKTSAGYMELSARAVGALNVTPRDLARYPLLMLGRGALDGRTYLSPESVARIERGEASAAARAGLKELYGLANLPSYHRKATFRGHGGAVDGALALAEYWPGHNSGFVLMWTVQKENDAAEVVRNYLTRDAPMPPPPKDAPVDGGIERLAGTYQVISVRQPFGEPFDALLNPPVVTVEGPKLVIDGKKFTHVGGFLFQREDRSVPTLAFDVSDREPRMIGNVAAKRVSDSVLYQRSAWTIAFGALSLFALFHLFAWVYGLFRDRLRTRGGAGLRVLPFMALGSIWALIGVVILISGLDTAVLLPAIGSQSLWALSLFVASLSIPIMGFLSFWRGLTAGYGAPAWIRLYAMAAGAVTLIAAAYLNDFGWIGIMTWSR
jgi:CubicO group peptidase (beta-lactamase class C family)